RGSAYGARGLLSLRKRTWASRTTQPGRLLCLRNGEEPPDHVAVQRRRFRQDRPPPRRAIVLTTAEWRLAVSRGLERAPPKRRPTSQGRHSGGRGVSQR